jgi:hypothetical protein
MTVAPIRLRTIGVILAALPLLLGCDAFDGGATPESARLELDSDEPQVVTVITSTDFDILPANEDGGTGVRFIRSDTAEYTAPDAIVLDIRARGRFYAKIVAGETLETEVAMRIFVDNNNLGTKLVQMPGDSTSFLYSFSGS